MKLDLRLTPSLWAQIAQAAMQFGCNPSEVVRAWIARGAAEDLGGESAVAQPWLYLG